MRPLTILIVEDQAVVRDLMVTVLVRENYRVLETDNVSEALEVSNTFDGIIDLLIADHRLAPRQVVQMICQSRPGLKVLRIVDSETGNDGGVHGANFLTSPFLPRALSEKVSNLLKAG